MAFLNPIHIRPPSISLSLPSRLASRRPVKACAASKPSPSRLEDRNVPSGHEGLHNYLYSGGDREHAADREEKCDEPQFFSHGGRVFPVELFLDGVADERVVGVYAIYNSKEGQCQYVGMGRDVGREIKALKGEFGDEVWGVRIKTWTFPKREEMIVVRDEWVKTHLQESDVDETWDKMAKQGWLKGEEKAKWEEKKTKLRKAMADATLVDEIDELGQLEDTDEARVRRERIIRSVEADDWSAEISQQTAQTVRQQSAPVVVSPFATEGNSRENVAERVDEANFVPLNEENVETVLDEVRPYLLSDGGNVSLVSIENNNIKLQLEGACGSCAASTTTMKMGIEKALRERFANLGEVTAVNEPLAVKEMSVSLVESILNEVRPAIEGLGGSFKVLAAQDGVVQLEFSGSENLVYGIELMLKDRLPDMRSLEVTKR